MLHQAERSTEVIASGITMMETISSRFGDITVDTGKAVTFPRGLLGMPDKCRFVLASFPNPKMQQFTLLQSLDDHSLSFITLPLDLRNTIIAEADLKTACRDLQIPESSLVLLLIVSVHRGGDQVKLSVNARAPLLIDAARKAGVQYVFQQDYYKVQHML
jgi:flagellar assembly factor FliW